MPYGTILGHFIEFGQTQALRSCDNDMNHTPATLPGVPRWPSGKVRSGTGVPPGPGLNNLGSPGDPLKRGRGLAYVVEMI